MLITAPPLLPLFSSLPAPVLLPWRSAMKNQRTLLVSCLHDQNTLLTTLRVSFTSSEVCFPNYTTIFPLALLNRKSDEFIKIHVNTQTSSSSSLHGTETDACSDFTYVLHLFQSLQVSRHPFALYCRIPICTFPSAIVWSNVTEFHKMPSSHARVY
jgi:hypothetical protein